jgi:RsiW-degrading membrane proteinase PrsW (M82 family)
VIDQFANAFLKVAFIEELSKFIFIRFILYYNKNFNEPYDGIIYAVMVGMGFATLENIIYVFQYGVGTGILRMFTAVPAHATFAILMGFYLGKAKFEHKKSYYALYALGVATLFHGAYDYCLFISFVPGIVFGALASLISRSIPK